MDRMFAFGVISEALEDLEGRSYVVSHVCFFKGPFEGRYRDAEGGQFGDYYKIPKES